MNFCYQCRRPLFDKRADAHFCSTRHRVAWHRVHDDPWQRIGERSDRRCANCDKLLWRAGQHWPRENKRYCSTRCRVTAHRAAHRRAG